MNEKCNLTYDYYGSPWESEADRLGGVDRKIDNTPWPADAPDTFWELLPLLWK